MNNEVLLKYLDNAAMEASVDDDEHIYITSGLDFPIWVILDEEYNRIFFQTYTSMKEISKSDAYEFVNIASSSVMMPNFYVTSEDDTTHYLYANYALFYNEELTPKSFINAARRFSEAFKFAATLDENDFYLP